MIFIPVTVFLGLKFNTDGFVAWQEDIGEFAIANKSLEEIPVKLITAPN